MIRKAAAGLGRSISDALFPPVCFACGAFIQKDTETGGPDPDKLVRLSPEKAFRHVMKDCLCSFCIEDFTAVQSPWCTRCGEPFKSSADQGHLCGDCITRKKHFSFARACSVYQGSVLNLLHAYKYTGRTGLAKPLGLLLFTSFIRHFSEMDIDTALAVPLHEKRLRSRGYNQSLLMILNWPEIAQKCGMHEYANIAIDTRTLVRRKNTATQTGLERSRRMKNIKNAFAVRCPERIKDRHLLLVDDVFTTGSTVEECARMLDNAGAAGVYVLTLARAV
ncbi:MAG: ComF family protein [Desulfobacterales bacterium]